MKKYFLPFLVCSLLLSISSAMIAQTDILDNEWVPGTGISINSGTLTSSGGGNTRAALAQKTFWTCKVSALFEVEIAGWGTGQSKMEIGFDATTSEYYYIVRPKKLTVVQKEKDTNVQTVKAVMSIAELFPGDKLKLSVEGSSLVLLKNGTEKLASINTTKKDGFFYVDLKNNGMSVTSPKKRVDCPAIGVGYQPALASDLELGASLSASNNIIKNTTGGNDNKIGLVPGIFPCTDRAGMALLLREWGSGEKRIVLGLETNDNKSYSFELRSNGQIIYRENGIKKGILEYRNQVGEFVEIALENDVLLLRNSFREDLMIIKGIPTFDEGNFYAELKGNGMSVGMPEVKLPCKKSALPYVELKDKLDGSYYQSYNDRVFFLYKEEYRDGLLLFKLYDEDRTPMMTESTSGLVLRNRDNTYQSEKKYGTNRYELYYAGAGLQANQFYILEVSNDKGETKKLRFKVQ